MRPNGEGIAAILMCLIATVALAGFNDFCLTGFSLAGGGQCKEQAAVALFTPSSKAFGTYTTGEVARQEFIVTNSGRGTFSNLSGSVNGTGFTVYSSPKCATAPCTFKTRFIPPALGNYTGHLTVKSDQFAASTAALSGTGVADAEASACVGGLEMLVEFTDGANPSTVTCTTGSDTTVALTGGAAISTSTTYCASQPCVNVAGEDDGAEIDSTGLPAGMATTGTWCGDYYHSSTSSGYAYSIGASIGRFTDGAGADDTVLLTVYGAESYAGTTTFSDNTITRVCYSWDSTQSAGADRLCNKVGANAWQCATNKTLTDGSLAATLFIAGQNLQFGRGYTDNIKLYSTYQAE